MVPPSSIPAILLSPPARAYEAKEATPPEARLDNLFTAVPDPGRVGTDEDDRASCRAPASASTATPLDAASTVCGRGVKTPKSFFLQGRAFVLQLSAEAQPQHRFRCACVPNLMAAQRVATTPPLDRPHLPLPPSHQFRTKTHETLSPRSSSSLFDLE